MTRERGSGAARSLVPLLCAAVAPLYGCSTSDVHEGTGAERVLAPARIAPPRSNVQVIASLLSGEFSNDAQAARSPGQFAHVRLVATPIWSDRRGEHWMYVEQAVTAKSDAPYRQRVYRVTPAGPDEAKIDVFTLPGRAMRFSDGSGRPVEAQLKHLHPSQLRPKAGASLRVRLGQDGSFWASTCGSESASTLNGASYSTSETCLWTGGLYTWDRGYDSSGHQVWGSTSGGYDLRRR